MVHRRMTDQRSILGAAAPAPWQYPATADGRQRDYRLRVSVVCGCARPVRIGAVDLRCGRGSGRPRRPMCGVAGLDDEGHAAGDDQAGDVDEQLNEGSTDL